MQEKSKYNESEYFFIIRCRRGRGYRARMLRRKAGDSPRANVPMDSNFYNRRFALNVEPAVAGSMPAFPTMGFAITLIDG